MKESAGVIALHRIDRDGMSQLKWETLVCQLLCTGQQICEITHFNGWPHQDGVLDEKPTDLDAVSCTMYAIMCTTSP